MSDIVDAAVATTERYNTPPAVNTTKDWQLLLLIGDEWTPHAFTGTASQAAEHLTELIDTKNDRWARGHSSKTCAAASDGEAQKAWHQHFGTS